MIRSSRRPFHKSLRSRLMLRSLEERITPATYTVTNTNDNGVGSLRQAIVNANGNAGADYVEFDPLFTSSSHTITLTSGQIDIVDSLIFFGPGAPLLTISGNNSSRIFDMALSGPSTVVTMFNVTLANGKATAGFSTDGGGGFRMGDETLLMVNCAVTNCFSDNNGGAIASVETKGTFNATSCTFSNNTATGDGGGVCLATPSSSVTLNDCSVIGNTANGTVVSRGGGIYVATNGNANIDRSSISGNVAGDNGGGIFVLDNGSLVMANSTISGNKANTVSGLWGGGGVGILGVATSLQIRNSTISGNTARWGGGISQGGALGTSTLQNNTIAFNDAADDGGGVFQTGGTAAWDSNIIAGNTVGGTSAPTGDVYFIDTHTVSGSNNLIGVQDSATNVTFGGGNLLGSSAVPLDAKLSPLANNGGPTKTHMPLPGSPVIDAGSNPAGLSTDQRGNQRAVGAQIDIGAVEAVSLLVTNTNDAGSGSLRQTLQHANSVAGPQTITFDSSFATAQTITLTSGQIDILDSVTIIGKGASLLTISGNNASRIFDMALSGPSTVVNLYNLTIANGRATAGFLADGGGGVRMGDESLTMNNCVVTGCSVNGNGGAIASVEAKGNFSATSCTFTNNTATGNGGGIYLGLSSGLVWLTNCSVANNLASNGNSSGGGIYLAANNTAYLDRSSISGNTAGYNGGGIYFFNSGAFGMADCAVTGNQANTQTFGAGGGGIYFYGLAYAFIVRNNTISGNSASDGGGICLPSFAGTSVLQNNTITSNNSLWDAGGITQMGSSSASWDSNIIAGNTLGGQMAKTGDVWFINPTNVAGSHNLIGIQDPDTNATFGAGNLKGSFATPLDAKLGPLANNGGVTKTHALLPGSPAIDAGSNPNNLPSDQRGMPRSLNQTDIGAYETVPTNRMVDIANDGNDNNFSVGNLSLREAIYLANLTPGPETITFDPTVFATAQTVYLYGQLEITDGVTVTAPPAVVTLDAHYFSRVLAVDPAAAGDAVSLSGLAMINGYSDFFDAGGIYNNDAALTLTNVTVSNCTTNHDGGGIYVGQTAGSLTLNSCAILNNMVTGAGPLGTGSQGGGIYVRENSTLVIDRSTIAGNVAAEDGGGIYFSLGGALTLTNSTISGNVSNYQGVGLGGGGVYFFGTATTFVLRDSTISGNSTYNVAGTSGGGLFLYGFSGTSVIQNCTITGNDAGASGGGIWQAGGSGANWDSNIIAGNTIGGSSATTANVYFGYATTIVGSKNLIGVQDAATNATFGGGNLMGSFATPLDAKLGPLANNGGVTKTHALLPGSPAIDAGSNLAGLSNDQRGAPYTRTSGKSIDIGAFEFQYAPTVTNVTFGDGSNQRSMVKQIVITFSEAVNFSGGVASAFTLHRTGTKGTTEDVTLSTTSTSPTTSVTLTFSGPLTEFGSLVDGFYDFTISAGQVSGPGGALDGNGDSIPGGSYFVNGNTTNKFFRLFGDADGDATTTLTDFAAFRGVFNLGANPVFDFDNDGNVSLSDFAQFRARFNLSP